MTVQDQKVYYLFCDECPPGERRSASESAANLEEAQRLAIDDDWIFEFDTAGRAHDMCPACAERRRQRECAERPEGHRWRRTWFAGEADDDGWVWIDMGAASYWKRFCLDCRFSEHTGGAHDQ